MEPVGVWEWFFIMIVLSIPIINLLVFIVSACGAGKPSFVNFSRAALVWVFLVVVVVIIISGS